MKFTDEELSKILTAHDNNGLRSGGFPTQPGYPGCIFQIAKESCNVFMQPVITEDRWNFIPSEETDKIASWFDNNYNSTWTVEEFIEKLGQKDYI